MGTRQKLQRKTIMIDGVRYYADRPHDCRKCFFWKNRKVGCTLGRENCYYLAEVIKTEQEKKCENCPYAKGQRRKEFSLCRIKICRDIVTMNR